MRQREEKKKRKENTTPFGVNSMRSPVLYRAAQGQREETENMTRFSIDQTKA